MHDRLQHEMATADAFAVGEGANFEHALATLHLALDHQVERALRRARADTPGQHARRVHLLIGAAKALEKQPRLLDPPCEISDRAATNGKFDQVESHLCVVARRHQKARGENDLCTGFKAVPLIPFPGFPTDRCGVYRSRRGFRARQLSVAQPPGPRRRPVRTESPTAKATPQALGLLLVVTSMTGSMSPFSA